MSDTFFKKDGKETGGKAAAKEYSICSESDYDSTGVENEEEETPSKPYPLQMRMRRLFKDQTHTDVTFYDQSDRKSHISAHRIVLSSESTLFEKMLFEETVSPSHLEIEISNISFNIFEIIVKYLYTDEIPPESSLLPDILDGAVRFRIKSLEDICLKKLRTVPISEKNVCTLLQISMERSLEALKADCRSFIQNNTLAVLKSPDFRSAEFDVICEICSLPALNMDSEVKLLEAVFNWAYSCKGRHKHLKDYELLRKIRFLTFTHEEFANIISKYKGLIKEGDALQILVFLNAQPYQRKFSNLPVWCNLQTAPRCQSRTNFKKDFRGPPVDEAGVYEIPLKITAKETPCLAKLSCMLNLLCREEKRYEITALRLSFQEPVSEDSVIDNLVLKFFRTPSTFWFQETIRIQKSTFVRVELSKKIRMTFGDSLQIVAKARGIRCYKFLEVDRGTAFQKKKTPFSFFASSVPDFGPLLFISGIEYTYSALQHKNYPARR